MAFVIKKIINGNPYYYLRESRRIGAKVISKNIAYFGKNKPSEAEIKEKLAKIKIVVPKNIVVPNNVVPKENLFKQQQNPNLMLSINDMAVFCKKKGFVYPNSEIYGGLAGFFDYGPLGVELKNNIKQEFWKTFVQNREDIVGIDGTILSHPLVWKASGHVDSFADKMIYCNKHKKYYRADQLVEDVLKIKTDGLKKEELLKQIQDNEDKFKQAGYDLENEILEFNLMFKTNVGPLQDEKSVSYLRPETAQLIFANFKLVLDTTRQKLPFGIAQIGKAFRNEISPRDFLFRTREFEQMEIEYFIHPKEIKCKYLNDLNFKFNILTAELQKQNKQHLEMTIGDMLKHNLLGEWHAYWLKEVYNWFLSLGINPNNLRTREHLKDELAHYSSACFDIEYKFPFGWREIHGNANRGQFDLEQHKKLSKQNLEVYDEESKEKILPRVIEPSQGVDRAFLAFMFDAYNDDKERGNIVLKLNPKLAPIKLGIFPLVNKLEAEAKKVYEELRKEFSCQYDRSGSVGRRYARADEIGIPFCITIDFDTLKDDSITIRNRDTTRQIRVKIGNIKETVSKLINGEQFETTIFHQS